MIIMVVKNSIIRILSVILLLMPLIIYQPQSIRAADKAAAPESPGVRKASIIFLEGMASLVGKDNKKIRQILPGDTFKAGDLLRTAIRGRLILQFPDGSYLRCDELTTVEITSLSFDMASGLRDIKCKVKSGKVWMVVSESPEIKGGIVLSAPMVIAETDSSTFRITIHSDNSAILKVYRGLLYIHSPKSGKKSSATDEVNSSGSKKNWRHYVKPMFQLFVRKDGTASSPFRFMTKTDRDDWVEWNQTLDKEIGSRVR